MTTDRKKYNRDYYLKNKDKILEKKKQDRKENKGERSEYHRLWEQKNKEKRREYYKNYRLKYPERKNASNKRWADKNPDKIKAYLKKYQSSDGYKVYLEKTREKRIQYFRKRYREDPEYRKKIADGHKRWREKNPDYARIIWDTARRKQIDKKIELKDDWLENAVSDYS